MSRAGGLATKHGESSQDDLTIKKRARSSQDNILISKKLKTQKVKPLSPKPEMTTVYHVKKFLLEASDKELDRLSEFLHNRKRKRNLGTSVIEQKRPIYKDRLQPTELVSTSPPTCRQRGTTSNNSRARSRPPKVSRRITAHALNEEEDKLFPPGGTGRQSKKRKLHPRYADPERSHRPADNWPEDIPVRPPGLDICHTLLSRAQLRSAQEHLQFWGDDQ